MKSSPTPAVGSIAFDADGNGRQANVEDGHFDYPRDCFTAGSIGGVAVPCLSVDQQLRFHAGYQPRDHDLHDLAGEVRIEPGTAGSAFCFGPPNASGLP